jgi:hypothetical protein
MMTKMIRPTVSTSIPTVPKNSRVAFGELVAWRKNIKVSLD